MAINRTNKNGKATKMAQVIKGARKHWPNGSTPLTLDGAPTTIDAVMNDFQSFIDNRAAVVAAQTTARNMVAAGRAAMPALNAVLAAFIAFVRNTLGASSAALADFGIPVRKAPAPKTAEQKAVATAKRKATRAARGTKGPKAKAQVHGNITAQLVVTPGPPPVAPAPAAPATGGTAQPTKG